MMTKILQNIGGLILVGLLLAAFSKTILAAAGDLDSGFGGDGIVSTPIPGELIGSATDIVIQPDGKPLVAVLARGQAGFDLAVIRYNTDGTLDTGFGGDGIFNSPFGSSDADTANSIALQTDGKILITGSLITGQTAGFAVLRLNADGSLDPSFDGDGIVVNSVLNSADGQAIEVQTDGKILVAGHAFSSAGDFFAVTRLNSDGSVDTSFGTNGSAVISFGLIDFFGAMALQPDGKIILLGDADVSSSNSFVALVRYNANGTLDNTFDGDGWAATQMTGLSGSAVALQTDGKILVGGSLIGDFAVLRYDPNGALDNTFDGDGVALASFDSDGDAVHDLIVQPDNKIIAVGETAVGPGFLDLDIATVRFNSNGSLDTGFGAGGKVVTRISANSDLANAVALQTDGKILLAGAGTELGSSQVTLVRYLNQNRTRFDFDGDGKADISLFRPSTNVWYIQNSSDNSSNIQSFGLSEDKPVAADFDGDGKTDLAVFRPSSGVWYWLDSSNGNFNAVGFGTNGDLSVPADYDGDGQSDLAVFRPSSGTWWLRLSSDNSVSVQSFGLAGDKPTTGDFDGDGRADIALYRPSNNVWYRVNSSNSQFSAYQFGLSEDKPTAGDYDGDGKTDIAVYRPSTGVWYRLNSGDNSFTVVQFGLSEDKPVPADFDGDGRDDIAVYRPSSGIWYLLRSTQGFGALQFGIGEDLPIPFNLD